MQNSKTRFDRRSLLMASLCGIGWLTPVAEALARAAERKPGGARAKSVISLWLQGGPSQLETFDPHPNTDIAAGSLARPTSVPGIQLGAGLEQVADQMHHLAIVRSVFSKEGDHERATYNMKTGFRPDPTLVHPSLGAVICHQLSNQIDIPRHVSIVPGQWPARGGYLGDHFDAFQTNDPLRRLPDVTPRVGKQRIDQRVSDLRDVVEREFARGRVVQQQATPLMAATDEAVRMMRSEQIKAFDVQQEPVSIREEFGDSAFGRGCLAAVRLIDTGVRCVEITLNGWDTHVNNHETHAERIATLDPAFAALIRHLIDRDLLESTIVICGGEFGRTPRVNPAGGRDHWPHGFSVVLAGGSIRGGVVLGETSGNPKLDEADRLRDVKDPYQVEDIHATVLHALGIDFHQELDTPVGRPMAISKGQVIKQLL